MKRAEVQMVVEALGKSTAGGRQRSGLMQGSQARQLRDSMHSATMTSRLSAPPHVCTSIASRSQFILCSASAEGGHLQRRGEGSRSTTRDPHPLPPSHSTCCCIVSQPMREPPLRSADPALSAGSSSSSASIPLLA